MAAPKITNLAAKNSLNCASLEDEGVPRSSSPNKAGESEFFEQVLMEDSPYPPLPMGDFKEVAHRQALDCAKRALLYYNKKHHTHYELVDPLMSSGFLDGVIWFHCNFTAKPKLNPREDDDQDFSTKLFFAEMTTDHVTACRILKGKFKAGCRSCCEVIKHPTHGFCRGLYRFQPHRTRSRSQGFK